MKVLITDFVDRSLFKLLKKNNIDYEYLDVDSSKEILKVISQFDGLIVRNKFLIDANFLHKARNLKFIARYGSGMELIDVKTANDLNIVCFNAGKGNSNAVGEHALGLLLCLFHKIYFSMNQLKDSIWEREKNIGTELSGKTIGIIGYGNTGYNFAQKIEGFNCDVLSYDKYKTRFSNKLVKEVEMQTIFEKCDIVSFHVPLNPETLHMFNKNFIDRMRKPFYIVNTSRGQIVSTKDLIDGIKKNKILGACLDVHENESPNFSSIDFNADLNYLLNCNKVILTPHIAGITKESKQNLSNVLIKKILNIK